MNFEKTGDTLVVFLEDRIDTTNAEAVGAEINNICKEAFGFSSDAEINGLDLVLDAEKLGYISSAGLRTVLNLRKKNPDLKVINVNSEVYEIFDMTGFTEMITVEKAFRQFSVDGCKVIGQGAKGIVYRYNDDTIVKVYKNPDSLPDIKNERALARRAFVLGIPTAISYDIVKVGESFGSVFELLDAKSYSDMIVNDEANRDKYIEEYALLLKKIHSTTVKADDMPDIKRTVNKWLEADKPYISEKAFGKLRKLIDETPDTLNMLHCDYHTNNVMYQNGEALLIDMDTLSHGHPVFELANVFITYVGFGVKDPSNVENFLGMPYDIAKYVWEKFFPIYLGTDDEARLNEVEQKIELLSCVRLLRHTVRRGKGDEEPGRSVIEYAISTIEKLVDVVDSLDF